MIFTRAKRENVGLLIGLAGGSGSGKTFSALRLATGMSGGKPFALIDTENRRGLHYADQFSFDHGDLQPKFSPQAYGDAIEAADKAGYPVIVVDSMTHEWAGDGGVLDMQEEEFKNLGSRDTTKLLSWAKPKGEHKWLVQRLLRTRAHLILCFRAEEKIEMSKDGQGKTVVEKKKTLTGLDGWCPICEKNLPFELTISFLLWAGAPGVPIPIKLQEQHRSLFPARDGKYLPITEECGRGLAAWAVGGAAKPVASPMAAPAPRPARTPVDELKARWAGAYPRGEQEATDAYRGRFVAWATNASGLPVTDPATMTAEQIDRCNIVLDEIGPR